MLIILIFLEYWAIVLSIFVFLGKKAGSKNNYYLAEIILGSVDVLFLSLIIFTILKIFKILGRNNNNDVPD